MKRETRYSNRPEGYRVHFDRTSVWRSMNRTPRTSIRTSVLSKLAAGAGGEGRAGAGAQGVTPGELTGRLHRRHHQ